MNELKQKRKEIENALKQSINKTTSSVKAIRLQDFNKICEDLVHKSVALKMTLVVKYMVENGHKMSQQSLYNKQDGNNPYRELYDLWSEYDAIKHSNSKPVINTENNEDMYIDHDDLKLIEDPALRYRISLMFGQLKAFKNQNNLMKQIKEMNDMQAVPEYMSELEKTSSLELNNYEVEILKDFISGNHNLDFSTEGALITTMPIRKGQTISNKGLKDTLMKIINNNLKDRTLI